MNGQVPTSGPTRANSSEPGTDGGEAHGNRRRVGGTSLWAFPLIALLVISVSIFGLALRASAHIDPDPPEAQAGSRIAVGFTVKHGCAGSPTVQVDMRLPDGVVEAAPEPPDGWTGTVDEAVVTFTGGPQPDDEELTFHVVMTLPPRPDSTIHFPFVQRCEVGEIRWIDLPDDGGDLDEPAPAMRLVGPIATTVPTDEGPTTSPPADSTPAEPTPATSAPASTSTTITPTSSAPDSTTTTELAAESEPDSLTSVPEPPEADDESGGGGSTGLIIAVVAIAVALGAAATIIVRRRRG